MEHIKNNSRITVTAIDAGILPGGYDPARICEGLYQSRVGHRSPTPRADGWTSARIHIFLHTLAQTGVVADAARAAGMSTQGAYAFRNSARGRGFDAAWRAALLQARGRIADEVMSRALHGCVDVIVRDGKVWGERHRFDNRLTMAVLTRLDALAVSTCQIDDAPRRVAHEFEAFVDAVCAGHDEAAAFIRARRALPYDAFDEAEIVMRNAEYRHAGAEGDDDEWQPETSSTSLDSEAPDRCATEPAECPSVEGEAPDSHELGAIRPAEAGAVRALSRIQWQATGNWRPKARGEDRWQPETSSISLDSGQPPGAAEPAPGVPAPG
jgi:hypothetical protein